MISCPKCHHVKHFGRVCSCKCRFGSKSGSTERQEYHFEEEPKKKVRATPVEPRQPVEQPRAEPRPRVPPVGKVDDSRNPLTRPAELADRIAKHIFNRGK